MFSFVYFIWIVLVGVILALVWLIFAALCYLTIIGIPIGRTFFQFAKLSISPYGKELVREEKLIDQKNISVFKKVGSIILEALWFPIGLTLASLYFAMGILSTMISVSKPIADVYFAMSRVVLAPAGVKIIKKRSVPSKITDEVSFQKDHKI